MTVYIEKPAVNLREELASLRNQGGYQEQQFYFDGLVTNGTFDADTDWTKGTGWTISGGVASSAGGTNLASIQQSYPFIAGRTYAINYTVSSYVSGTFLVQISGGGQLLGGQRTANGTYSENFLMPTNLTSFEIVAGGGSGAVGSIDNVSLFETDGTDVIYTMPKGWKPKDFYEDGLLQREGAANDYEVVYDGFDYKVKPAVAPSATTQTCVIGVKA